MAFRVILVIAFLLVLIALWCSPYKRTFAQRQIYVLSDVGRLSQTINAQGLSEVQFLDEMCARGTLLTADEFASRITSYYNTLVAVLGTMFIFFTFVTYFSLRDKFLGKEKEMEEKMRQSVREMLRDSVEVRNDMISAVKGSIDGQFVAPEEFLMSC